MLKKGAIGIFSGCGCLTIGFVIFCVVLVWWSESDDAKKEEEAQKAAQTEQVADSVKKTVVNPPLESDPFEELDELIGLAEVKEEVNTLANYVRVQKQREAQGLKIAPMNYHLVFTGSPGTGKTTVARIVGRIYKDLGILKKGHMVETDRSGLVGAYVGQTAIKTNEIVDSALNGVLFIDEAYTLSNPDVGSDYGHEAIATLLKRMEDDRDSLVVIVAGYTNEMKTFINDNPGLQSRFNRYIDFPDYNAPDLCKIFQQQAKKNQYDITPEALEYLSQHMDYVVAHKTRNFGNARYARNLFEKAIQAQANRIGHLKNPSREQLTEITVDDLKNVGKIAH